MRARWRWWSTCSRARTGTFLDQSANHILFGKLAREPASRRLLPRRWFRVAGGPEPRGARGGGGQHFARGPCPCPANATRNSLTLTTVEANVFDFLTDEVAAGRATTPSPSIPPAFAKTKAARDAAWRGYKEINRRALQLLEPGGVLFTCSCSYHVSEEDFEAVVADAAADSGITAQISERRSQSPDHPVRLGVPETRYLKALVIRKLNNEDVVLGVVAADPKSVRSGRSNPVPPLPARRLGGESAGGIASSASPPSASSQ